MANLLHGVPVMDTEGRKSIVSSQIKLDITENTFKDIIQANLKNA